MITNIARDTNGVRVAWPGDSTFNYRVETASNNAWSAVTTLEGRVGANLWTDPAPPTTRWYRVVTP
ncbi:MAG: hypothetical protein BWK77_05160 [Verrucomicrobia bacterium A1]|nr:MAG: hypothetical protein BWK77_05160 [Verrucomicrobia bacterium A1]